MRKRSFILLAFLLALYIGPLILAPSYASLTTPTEQNMNKDFSLSSEPWLMGWAKRKQINITGSNGAGANYQVNLTVTYDSDMQNDFDDVRFTDDNKITELYYWLEDYTASTSAEFWVNVTDDLDSNQTIYMYYDNDGVSTTSSGPDTFIFFDDFELNDFSRWTSAQADWSVSTIQKKHGTYSARGDSSAVNRVLLQTQSISSGVMFHTWSFHEDQVSEGSQTYPFSSTVGFIGYTDANDIVYNNGTTYFYEENAITTSVWYEYEIGWSTAGQGTFYRDGVEKNTVTISATSPLPNIRALVDTVTSVDFYLDDYYIRKWIKVEPAFDAIGSEETYEASWRNVGTAELIFSVAVDTVGLDLLLIIGGLILVPCSALYLVKGGKDGMSQDKFFYFCIAFIMGWALFLGGIM